MFKTSGFASVLALSLASCAWGALKTELDGRNCMEPNERDKSEGWQKNEVAKK